MMNSKKTRVFPWLDGHYRLEWGGHLINVAVVEGNNVTIYDKMFASIQDTCNFKDGIFGETSEVIAKATGKKHFNIEVHNSVNLKKLGMTAHGVSSEDGKKITIVIPAFGATDYLWITQEEATAMKEDGDLADAPPSHHKIQPENLGKFLWISGPPGIGKSTTCQVLMETQGFVYYEGDCFMGMVNPYIPPSGREPLDTLFKQRPLKGVLEETQVAIQNYIPAFLAMCSVEEYDKEIFTNFYTALAVDIGKERRRMGGDWAVAQAVPDRYCRDLLRSLLGPELVFIVLHMDREVLLKRLDNRKVYGKGIIESWIKMSERYEPAAEDEENVIDLKVTWDMSTLDVIEKILEIL